MGLFDIFRRKKKVKGGAPTEKAAPKAIEPTESTSKKEAVVAEKPTPKAGASEKNAEAPKVETKTERVSESKKAIAPAAKKDEKASVSSADKSTKVIDEPIMDIEESDPEGEVITESKPTRTGKFEVKRAKDGRYHFNLYASNHILIARSQVYSSSSKAMQGINSVIANAPKAKIEDQTLKNPVTVPFPKWEIYIDNGGRYRFRLCATNGSCICHSRGYTTKASCKNGIDSITRFANDAEIKKVYLDKK